MQALTIYLKASPAWPLRGFRDDQGAVRIGTPGGFDQSRPLTDAEIEKIEGDANNPEQAGSLDDALPFP